MDLRQLEIVRAIAETGSFTGAGARLNVSQSAISRQILLLEDEFHERLFVRLGRRVQITAAGEVLLQLSHRVFNDIRDTSASITDRQKVLTGPLNLVGGMTVCLYVFPLLLKEFRTHHPHVDIKIARSPQEKAEVQAGVEIDLPSGRLRVVRPEETIAFTRRLLARSRATLDGVDRRLGGTKNSETADPPAREAAS